MYQLGGQVSLSLTKVLHSIITIIDISVPTAADKHISAKEEEKLSKYQDLRIELGILSRKKAMMVSIVIEALGSITKRLQVVFFFGDFGYQHTKRLPFAKDCFTRNSNHPMQSSSTLRVWVAP